MALDKRDTIEIPHPRALPLVGNLFAVTGEVPILQIADLGKQYGEIFSLYLGGQRRIFVSSQAMMHELCDEKRFKKTVGNALKELRSGVHDGLFTAYDGEENWLTAHRVLVPAFGPLNINGMFNDMKDIASQLVLKWARHGESYRIPVSDDFTRLTLDTLTLCAMDFRFNSFYTEEMHPFVDSMVNFLKYADVRAKRPAFMAPFYSADEKKWFADQAYMRDLANSIVKDRRSKADQPKDLLNAMINGKDPKTGKPLTDDSAIDNMITFLIAGHETTSGMLSFVFYYLLRHPEAYRKAQQEVDDVVGCESVRPEHLNKLPYITAILRETARLQSTAPAFALAPRSEKGEILGGKYFVGPDEAVLAVLHNVHRDPAVYGEDAEEFVPERMLDEEFEKLPPNSWKPFGNGARGCIGRPFAWQEMMLVMAMLLQYYNFTLDDPQYNLKIAFTLTIKPKDLYMKATLREGWTARSVEQSLSGSTPGAPNEPSVRPAIDRPAVDSDGTGKPMTILYGSNSGTCEAFAQTLAADATAHGFAATKVQSMDSARQKLPTEEPVIIITASYEGQPCDNAGLFLDWLQNLPSHQKLRTNFAVFGCGHSDWKRTFHKVPITIDDRLEKAGGERLCEIGLANAANACMMSDFQTWEDQTLWPALQKKYSTGDAESGEAKMSQNVSIEVFSNRASNLRSDVYEAKVVATQLLTAADVPEKKNIELQLPSTMTYKAGDYCAVLPLNPPELVHRVMARFGLPWDAMLKITSRTGSQLPTEHPVSAQTLLSAYVELSQPATKRNVAMLIEASDEELIKNELTKLSGDEFTSGMSDKRVSLLDLLEKYPTIQLPLGAFVGCLISMRVRQYSISSSPLSDATKLSLTYAVLDEPSLSGSGRHVGVASHYLSTLRPNDVIHVSVKPSHQAFHLPTDAENTPIVMIAAGTGLAPFRGFIQERAAQIGSGRGLAAAHLYFGCRHPSQDDLYREELDFWEKIGAVAVHRAYSQAPEKSSGYKHVDEAVLADKELLLELWEQNARVYVCGSRGLGESAKSACIEIAREAARKQCKSDSDEALDKWFESIRNERYSTDVFA